MDGYIRVVHVSAWCMKKVHTYNGVCVVHCVLFVSYGRCVSSFSLYIFGHLSSADVVAHSVRQPYILKALTKPPEKGGMVVQRDHWWELLCVLKDAPSPHMEEICALMGNPHIKVHLWGSL